MVMRQVILGADPDMRRPSIAAIDADNGNVLAVRCIKVPGKAKNHAGVLAAARATRGCFDEVLAMIGDPPVVAIVVEGQEIAYTARSGANPRSVMFLANVAGALISEACDNGMGKVFFPSPNEWKGTKPKHIHQPRILSALGWEYGVAGTGANRYAYPKHRVENVFGVKGADALLKSDWKHVVDAIGLAQWGRKQISQGAKQC